MPTHRILGKALCAHENQEQVERSNTKQSTELPFVDIKESTLGSCGARASGIGAADADTTHLQAARRRRFKRERRQDEVAEIAALLRNFSLLSSC